jgi:A/G-specific adenine glycosylase
METCVALREGTVSQLPAKLKTLKVRERQLAYIYIRWQGQTAIHRRGEGDIWQGLYEPLCIEEGGAMSVECGVRSEECGGSPLILLRQAVRHVLTHRVLLADFYLWEPAEQPPLPDGYFWISEDDIDRYALPRLIEKMVEEVRKHDENEGYVNRNE